MRRFTVAGVGAMVFALVALVSPLASAADDPVGADQSPHSVNAGGFSPAAKVLITFNDVASQGNPILTHLSTHGYAFDGLHFHSVDDPGTCSFGGCVDNGTIYIAEEEGGLGQPIVMTRKGGGKFCLKKIDLGQMFLDDAAASAAGFPNAASVTLTGTKVGGGHVVRSFAPPDTGFATFRLPHSFKGLLSVELSADGGFGSDNIAIRQG